MARGKRPGSRRKTDEKTVTLSGQHWRKNGAGWDLRKDVYVTSNGLRKQKQPYVAHMSAEAFRKQKSCHKGAALEKAIAEWIAERDQ
jgi:hypothetical protein